MGKLNSSEFITTVISKEPYIDSEGNIAYTQDSSKVCLTVKEHYKEGYELKKVSKNYCFMCEISDDHYIVCDVNTNQKFIIEGNDEFDNSNLSFKFGVVALQRDSEGNIIPMKEKTVVPMVYDDMCLNTLQTVTAMVNERWTYIDINPDSKNYGKQLVPAILQYALPFSEEYEGFAECSVDGVTGYLPRNCEPKTSLSKSDLLNKEQIEDVVLFLETSEDSFNKNSESCKKKFKAR